MADLQARLAQPQGFSSYGEVQQWLQTDWGIELSYTAVHQLVRYRLKAKLKVPRPRSVKADLVAQTTFKKLPLAMRELQRLQGGHRRVRYLCQDETRLGLKTLTGCLLTALGIKPIGLQQWPREAVYLYGIVEPLSGFSFFYEFSHLDSTCFQEFLNQLSVQLGADLAMLQLDQCSAHCAQAIEWTENIIPIFQPAHSPELNPIERVWQALKRPLRWQNYPSLAALREAVTEVLETLTPEHLMSLTSYDFVLETLLSAAS